MKDMEHDLRAAFPAMPEQCRAALSHAARSVKEEERMKRKYPVAILVAALLTLMTTIAIAEGWNVLGFLMLEPDSDAQTLVQPVSVSASGGNVTLRIDSAITDGEYLAFDWTVENTKPETPVYLVVESFTANGEKIFIDGTDDFHCHWLTSEYDRTMMQGGDLTLLPENLPEGLTEDTFHVEMVVGVYTPTLPVWYMDDAEAFDEETGMFDRERVRAKLEEGYYVIVGVDGLVYDDPQEGVILTGWSQVNERSGKHLTRSEIKVSFDLDLKAGRESVRTPELPSPVAKDGATLAVSSISISPLQSHIIATFTPKNASYEDIVAWTETDGMGFVLYDTAGNELNEWDLAANLEGGGAFVREAADGTWYLEWDMTYIGVTSAMPDQVILAYEKNDYRAEMPITLK